MPAPIHTAIAGASGYVGIELARLLLRHPRVSSPVLFTREVSSAAAAGGLAEMYPALTGTAKLSVLPFSWTSVKEEGVELLYLATPHEVSREWVPQAVKAGVRVIDLSGAWRLREERNRKVYGYQNGGSKNGDATFAESLMEQAVYGIPELHRNRIKGSQLVANAGCYATSIILALAPLLRAGLVDVDHGIVCDSKSGVSGAGKQPSAKTHFVEVADNLSAYSVFGHRHTGELLEQLGLSDSQIVFTPHLLPIPRGILSTIYLRLKQAASEEQITSVFNDFYQDSPWVRFFGTQLPQIRYSLGSNFCDIGFNLANDGRRVVLVSCLDNLIKGAAGQAVQNMNVMYGWDEKEGLD